MRTINDYIVVKIPDHQKAMHDGYVYEHVIVAEKMLGRPLREDEDVHHIDFNVQNNLVENLLVMNHGQHRKFHNYINRYGLRGLFEATALKGHHVRKCKFCDDYLGKKTVFCNKECQEAYWQQKRDSRPSKNELEDMLNEMTKNEISKIFNVHPSTISWWAKEYELI